MKEKTSNAGNATPERAQSEKLQWKTRTNKTSEVPGLKQALRSLHKLFKRGYGKKKREIRENHKKNKRRKQEKEYIFSAATYKKYKNIVYNYFVWLHENGFIIKQMQDAVDYIQPFLDFLAAAGNSPCYIKTVGCAILKLYPGRYLGNYKTPPRSRKMITKSRAHDLKYCLKIKRKYPVLFAFGLCIGLRKKKELAKIKGTDLVEKGDAYFVHVRGKNGQYRNAPIIGEPEMVAFIVQIFHDAGERKIFGPDGAKGRIPSDFDEHCFRAIYASKLYAGNARPIKKLEKEEKYYCRGDYKGIVLDRRAMKIASEALGHHRVSIIAQNYLWPLITMPRKLRKFFGLKKVRKNKCRKKKKSIKRKKSNKR